MTSPPSILRATWRSLLAPRRLVPVTLLSAALVVAQHAFGGGPGTVALAAAMCVVAAMGAPVAWRVLFPVAPEDAPPVGRPAVRLMLYGAVAVAFVLVFGRLIPDLAGLPPSLLTDPGSLFVSLALFLVGGWGLGHDMERDARLHHAEARAAALAVAAERAELLAIRANLDPHFLFNTLNAIAEWCRADGAVAETAVLRLSDLLRGVLDGVRAPTWSLARELALARAVCELYALRDAELRFSLDVAPGADGEVPPMLLLPLLDNAWKHGPAAGHTGEVRLTVRAEAPGLLVAISNPGDYAGPRPGGAGLDLVTRRTALAYGTTADFAIASHAGVTTATLRLPRAPMDAA